jgi:hypothetical protein
VALVLLKLGLTPALIAVATLASRRWGPAVGGLLIALPLTSGPVLLFLALDHGAPFAVSATEGSLAGAVSVAAFCTSYAWAGRRLAWWAAFGVGCAGFAAASVAMQPVASGPVTVLFLVALAAPLAALRLLPARIPVPVELSPPWWDLPARMAFGAALVVGITAGAPVLGPRASGLLATFPVFITVLAVFTHRREGPARAVLLLRGALIGMFGTIAFFIALHTTLDASRIWPAFVIATGIALAIQGLGLRVIRRD